MLVDPVLTRRSLLAAGAVALGGAAGLTRLASAPAQSGPVTATDLRRCVALGPAGCIFPGSAQDYTVGANAAFFRQTGTRWARLWADWPTLEPTRGSIDAAKFAALDRQIAAARRDGLRVVLTLYRFPMWANGYDSSQDASYEQDRRSQNGTRLKDPLFKIPADVGPGSDWAAFCARILDRYGRGSATRPALDAVIDVLEVCNEPNLQWWPQQGPSPDPSTPYSSGPITVHRPVADMFAAAQQLVAARPLAPIVAGPACADTSATGRLSTGWASFTDRFLNELDARAFVPGAAFAYTQHNYDDVTNDRAVTAPGLRTRLTGRWAGWPSADAANPGILLTEGGVTLTRIQSLYPGEDPRAKQAALLRSNWDRMAVSPGIAMTSHYLWYTDPNFDSGLCDTSESGGATRPAFATWGGLPSRG